MYPLDGIKVPGNFLPEYPWKDEIGNPPILRDEALAPFPRTEYAVKKHRQEYYAIITHLDEQIGKIWDALEASGKMDNTYIFFGSDHGLSVGQHGLIGKQSLFDHSIRIPMMVIGPDIPKGKQLDQDVYLQDIMATSLELANVQKPEYVQFKSFMDLISGKNEEGNYDAIYGAYIDLQRMIRKDNFKLLVYPEIDKILLFDLKKDPLETNNIADEPQQAQRVKSLFTDLLKLQRKMQDPLDLTALYQML
jgi:arylsulfatase A-like enzyme